MTRRRRAVAMLLVVCVVALCTAIGVAMLLSVSVQAQATGNAVAAAQAESLADSGAEMACYYLMNPGEAPGFVSDYWRGATGLTLGDGVRGTIDIAIARMAENCYHVRSTGRVPTGPDGGIARSVDFDVRVSPGFQVKSGLSFWSGATIPLGSVVTSDIQTVGVLTLYVPVPGYALRVLGLSNLTGTLLQPLTPLTDANRTFIPDSTAVRDYLTYTWQGRTCSARPINVAALANATLNPTEDNPAGVYYRAGALSLGQSVVINGTLVVIDGTLTVVGNGNAINPAAGFPAAVIKGDVDLRCSTTAAPQLRFNGLAWIGGLIRATLPAGMRETFILRGTLSADGALLVRGGTDTPTRYKFWVHHNPDRIKGVELDASIDPAGIVIKSFR